MLRVIKPDKLGTYLRKIEQTFPALRANRPLSTDDISRYYEQSALGYALFHSSDGAIHMGISRDESFNKNDHFGQAEEIVAICEAVGRTGSVLEAGCGRGFNLGFIGSRLPHWRCVGVDITPGHVQWARKRFSGLANVRFELGDFHRLEDVVTDPQQVVFFVESICHANDLRSVLRSANRVMAANGKVVIFDGFRLTAVEDQQWRIAAELVEAAMAVPRFPTIEEFKNIATEAGFTIDVEQDLSDAIMPNLLKLSDTAKAFFKIPPLSRFLTRILPPHLVANSVAGLLMPLTVSKRVHVYYKIVLSKRAS